MLAAGCFTSSRTTSSGPGRLKPRKTCSVSSPLKPPLTGPPTGSPTSFQTACELARDSALLGRYGGLPEPVKDAAPKAYRLS